MQHKKKQIKTFVMKGLPVTKRLVNMILSIGSSTGGFYPISGGKLYWANLF